MNRITFNELKDSDEIFYRNHRTSKVVVSFGLRRFMNQYGGKPFNDYTNDLIHKTDNRFDIVKIIREEEIIYIENGFIKEEIKALKKQIGSLNGKIISCQRDIEASTERLSKLTLELNILEDMMETN